MMVCRIHDSYHCSGIIDSLETDKGTTDCEITIRDKIA